MLFGCKDISFVYVIHHLVSIEFVLFSHHLFHGLSLYLQLGCMIHETTWQILPPSSFHASFFPSEILPPVSWGPCVVFTFIGSDLLVVLFTNLLFELPDILFTVVNLFVCML